MFDCGERKRKKKKPLTLIANYVESVVSCSSGSLEAKYANFSSQFAPISWNVASGGGKGKNIRVKKKKTMVPETLHVETRLREAKKSKKSSHHLLGEKNAPCATKRKS